MVRTKRRKAKEGPLEKKWQSYVGTGIVSTKGRNGLALREGFSGKEFAIVKLYGGFWSNSSIKVLEVIGTSDLKKAKQRFNDLSRELGFSLQPIRSL